MSLENMPSNETIRGFADKLSRFLSKDILQEKERSRVVLIGDEGSDLKV